MIAKQMVFYTAKPIGRGTQTLFTHPPNRTSIIFGIFLQTHLLNQTMPKAREIPEGKFLNEGKEDDKIFGNWNVFQNL